MDGVVTGAVDVGRALWSQPHGNLLAATGLWTDAAADAALEFASHWDLLQIMRHTRQWRPVCTHVSLALTCRAAFQVHRPLVRRTLAHLADLLNAARYLLDAATPDGRTWVQWARRMPRPAPDFLGLLHVLLSNWARWPRGTCSAVATFQLALTSGFPDDLEDHLCRLGMAWGNDAAYEICWPPTPEHCYWALRSGNVHRYQRCRRRVGPFGYAVVDVVLQAVRDDAPLAAVQAAYWLDESDLVWRLPALFMVAKVNRDPRVAAFVQARIDARETPVS